MFQTEIKPFILGAAVGVMGAAVISSLENIYPRYRYQTVPDIKLPFKVADVVLEETFMRFKKIYAHHWHWEDVQFDPKLKEFGVFLEGAPIGNPQNNPLFGAIAHLGGRPLGYLMDIDRENPELENKEFFVGFNWPGAQHLRRCKLKLSRSFFLMAGPDNGCIAYAMDENGNPLHLKKMSDLIDRREMPPGVRVL